MIAGAGPKTGAEKMGTPAWPLVSARRDAELVAWGLGLIGLTFGLSWWTARRRRRTPIDVAGAGERLLREGPFALVVWDRQRRIVDWNDRAERLFGWTKREAIGRDAFDLLVPASERAKVAALVDRLLADGEPASSSNANRTKSGKIVLCEWHSIPCRKRRGRVSGVVSFAADITDRRRVESERHSLNQARRRSETRLRRLFQSNLVGIGVGDADGQIREANDSLLQLLGYSRRDLDAGLLTWKRLIPPDGEPLDLPSLVELERTGSGAASEREFVKKNGARVPVLFGVASFDSEESSIVCFAVDISERKRAERDVRAAHCLIEAIRQAQLDFIEGAAIGPALERLLQTLLELTGSRRGLIAEVSRDESAGRRRLTTRAAAGFEDRTAEDEFAGVVEAVLVAERPLIGESSRPRPELSPERGSSAAIGRAPTFLCLPCRRGPTLLAAIAIADRPEGYDESVIAFLEPVATTCAGLFDALREEQRRSRVEAELQASKEAAEAAGQAKDRFLAILSHELRTPLTPVLVAATAMLEEGPSPEARPFLEMVRRNIELEARLIDDLLDVSRIVRGELRLDRRRLDVHEQIRRAVEICEPETAASGISVALDLAAADRYVEADRARLLQIFWNLIRNACKFTPAGGRVTIRSRSLRDEQGAGARLILEFEDTGSGISADVLPRIFEPFEQGSPNLRGRHGGLGLGLAISRSVAEAHGGRLEARSDGPGLGSVFRLELRALPSAPDLAANPPAKLAGEPPRSLPSSPHKTPSLRILLVEDNPDTLRYLGLILRRRGHRVRDAADLESARRAAREEDFDLLISDIELPDGNGLDLFRELAVERGAPLPGIAMSGFGSEDDVLQARAAGFFVHLTKPIDFSALDAAIRRAAFAEIGAGLCP